MKIKSQRTLLPISIIVILAIITFAATCFLPDVSKDTDKVSVVIPAGLASSDVGRQIKKSIPSFNSKEFAELAKPYEGYLFPDTYFFNATITPQQVIDAMRENFDARTKWLLFFNPMNGRSFSDILIVASLIEEEAGLHKDRRIISGIIWKRLGMNMALQLDSPFFYLLGKASHQLTYRDLAMDSPYNLYKNKGLPPAPIDNPSLDAISAALNPIKTDYLYFLSDSEGNMHFSKTFEEHIANKEEHID